MPFLQVFREATRIKNKSYNCTINIYALKSPIGVITPMELGIQYRLNVALMPISVYQDYELKKFYVVKEYNIGTLKLILKI